MLTREEQEKEMQELNVFEVVQKSTGRVAMVRTLLTAFEIETLKAKVEGYYERIESIKKRYEELLAKKDEATFATVKDVELLFKDTLELKKSFREEFIDKERRPLEESMLIANIDLCALEDLLFKLKMMENRFFTIAQERAAREEEDRKRSGGCSCCQRHIHGWYY
jgi:hypothetical protein